VGLIADAGCQWPAPAIPLLADGHGEMAVGYAFDILASQPRTKGSQDRHSFKVPKALQPGFKLLQGKVFGVAITGEILPTILSSYFFLVFLFFPHCRRGRRKT
jgi:hypothetical protein